MSINKIIIRGKVATTESALRGETRIAESPVTLIPEAVYELSPHDRDFQQELALDISDKVIELTFEDGTTWMCDSATLHDLYPAAESLQRSTDGFVIPPTLKSADGERSIVGEIAARLLKVFAKKAICNSVKALAEKLEKTHLGDREGLSYLTKTFAFEKFTGSGQVKPMLLFIHGTNSDTKGAFEDLSTAEVWNEIFNTYGKNVLAFEHRTLTKSPLENTVALAKQLPDGAELHVITHSRGGLIADILAKYSRDNKKNFPGFSVENIQLLKKENRVNDIECIRQLNDIFSRKKITLKKLIRVAAPAAGTKLASKRLDQVFNILYNLLGRNANDVAVILKELIATTIKTKEDTSVLPGIEAMGPESPFIKILNDRTEENAVEGNTLAVIAGNGKLSLSFRALLVIMGKLFYQQRNDLVVNTDSMYLGARRAGSIQYFFDEGKAVDHISYFKNYRTREAISFALKTEDGKNIPGFTCVEQYNVPASDRSLLNIEYGELEPYPDLPTGKKPIVVLLPGIMGSNLSKKNNKIWLAYVKAIFGGLTDLEFTSDTSITATSLIKTSYKKLADRLLTNYDVVIYPFDWRRQLNDAAKDFNDKITELLKLGQPIKIIGHSMGGVLVRDFIINHPETWLQLNTSPGFRLLFLGSPLGGSHRIPAVLFGNDAIINSLNMLDRIHTKKELISMFVNFPGILSLLPLTTDEQNDFASIKTWEKMRESLGDCDWPLPSPAQLEIFKAYRNNINALKGTIDYSNMVYIAGKDKFTACGYFNDVIPPRTELVFLYTAEGDQSVTWESGIPQKMIDDGNVYYANVTHGALANDAALFEGIEEILLNGSTNLISKSRPLIRGDEKLFRLPDIYNFDLSEKGLEAAILGITENKEQPVNNVPLSISVSHGDLAYASFPLLAGHFMNDGILYAEKSVDIQMTGTLSARHSLGIYPGEIGTSAALTANNLETDFPGAIIVGLGEPGTLTPFLLTQTIEQAISKYLLDMNNQPADGKDLGVSTLIIGCGYGGLSVENAVKSIIEGINKANTKVSGLYKNNIRLIQYIEFIELYEDRALNCMYTLKKIETKENRLYNIRIGNKKIKTLFGQKKRLPVDFSEEWWRRITVKTKTIKEDSTEVPALIFSSSTGDAREEEKELFTGTRLIDLFIEQISTQNNWSPASARTLFELMIPNEFKERLKRKGSINWIVEQETAAYPWELLQDKAANAKPLCVNAGMIRQLSIKDFRLNIKRVSGDNALIVADPQLDGFVSQLDGAKKEGEIVDKLLDNYGYARTTLINKQAAEIVQAMFAGEYRILHIAGHGLYNPQQPQRSGVVIGNGLFLTAFDIEQMNAVPELVFINCCHLGKVDAANENMYRSKYKLAANIGTQLIQMGVKAVVAAGWAVADQAAHDFAEEFYARMFAGYNFGDAVKEARELIYDKHHTFSNTWGAYQCYGDPFYKLINRTVNKTAGTRQYIMAEEVIIDLINLKNDLDTKNYSTQQALDMLEKIKAAKSIAEINDADSDEIEAMIYYELGEYDKAVKAFDELRATEKASFSVAALEKYCNVRCKKYVEDYKLNGDHNASIKKIKTVIGELEQLSKIKSTSDRNILTGSAYKRIAFLATDQATKLKAYTDAEKYYTKSCAETYNAYGFKSQVMMQYLCDLLNKQPGRKPSLGGKAVHDVIERINKQKRTLKPAYRNMDYWELMDDVSLDFLLLLLQKEEALREKNWSMLETKFKRIWKKAGSMGKKKAEIENFEIFADGLQATKNRHALLLKNRIDELRQTLERVLGE
ncbi:CHAT domain-containing protein [Panacibacter sp. DH6]|uniref:CHAT domain-containing protein n=1 Tax=Panacibacter microcysteis TaxID=2793269 RepID=A0A931E3U3_9BACT|nr:CHAT domain-containing protein [Panacibacter microcysteis]MBG9377115.1 CHAT domain-containing protein [Panacibacter microcysteis]